jgi:hypothetical protein
MFLIKNNQKKNIEEIGLKKIIQLYFFIFFHKKKIFKKNKKIKKKYIYIKNK